MQLPAMPVQAKPFLWGMAVGAIALTITGFTWGGWMTDSTADALAQDHAEAAVVTALTPACVNRFRASPEASANLAALKDIDSSWKQRNYVRDGGWATMPESSPVGDRALAESCAEALNSITL